MSQSCKQNCCGRESKWYKPTYRLGFVVSVLFEKLFHSYAAGGEAPERCVVVIVLEKQELTIPRTELQASKLLADM